MRRIFLLFCSLLACVALAATAFVFNLLPTPLQVPYVLSIEPLNGALEVTPTTPIKITFSTPMDRVPTENSVQIQPPLDGDFTWDDDQTLRFTPRERLPIATTLTVNISQVARSQLQRPLPAELVTQFTTLSRPMVVTSSPARDAQFVYVPDRVTIVFSRAMEPGLLGDTLQVEPQPQNFLFDVDGNTLTLYGYFEPKKQYQVTIPAMAMDAANGVELGTDYTLRFTVVSQYPNFSILNRDRVFTFPADAPVQLPVQLTNVSRLDVALYPLTEQEFETNASAPFETWYQFEPAAVAKQTMTVFTNAQRDRYTPQTIALGTLAAGDYYLKIMSPEGVGDVQLLVVE